ncbi:MAG: ubiquitin-protein ligase [Maritalea sp.]|jgi:ubiquitin-protein ligase
MQRFLRRLDAQLRKLEEMTETARNDLNTAGQRLSNSSYFDYLVEVFSGVYLQYMPASSVGLNKRYPENSPYMQFIRKSAKPLIGHEHGLVEQMKNYRDKLKS